MESGCIRHSISGELSARKTESEIIQQTAIRPLERRSWIQAQKFIFNQHFSQSLSLGKMFPLSSQKRMKVVANSVIFIFIIPIAE